MSVKSTGEDPKKTERKRSRDINTNLKERGQTANTIQNTTNQGYQQDR